MPLLTLKQAKDMSMKLMTKAGIPERDAAILFDGMFLSSLRGHDSHGIRRIPSVCDLYIRGLELGETGKPEVVKESSATALIDAKWYLGAVAAAQAANLAIEKAKKTGIAAVTIKNVPNMGPLGYHVENIAKQDMIGMMFVRSTAQLAPPYGGAFRAFGTNPMALAVPTGKEKPILIDMATTSIAVQALIPLLDTGNPLPPGLALDEEGMPTTDPSKVVGSGANRKGFFASMGGGPKGYAVMLMIDMLAGPLADSDWTENPAPGKSLANPTLIIAINISTFTDVNLFKARVDERIRMIKNGKKAKGFDEIFIPGERSFRTEQKRREDGGIPISDKDWQLFLKMADRLGVELEPPLRE